MKTDRTYSMENQEYLKRLNRRTSRERAFNLFSIVFLAVVMGSALAAIVIMSLDTQAFMEFVKLL